MRHPTGFSRINALWAQWRQARTLSRLPESIQEAVQDLSALFAVPVERLPVADLPPHWTPPWPGMRQLPWKVGTGAPLNEIAAEVRTWHHWQIHRLYPMQRWLSLLDAWWTTFQQTPYQPNPFWHYDVHVADTEDEAPLWICFEASATRDFALQDCWDTLTPEARHDHVSAWLTAVAHRRHPWPEEASEHVVLTALGDTLYELFQEWWPWCRADHRWTLPGDEL